MSDSEVDQEQPFLSHLVELRDRILKSLLGVLAVALVLLPFSNSIFRWFADPLIDALPGGEMASISVIGPFFIPLKVTLFLSFCVALPWILYQVWAFVAPGLYRHERRLVLPLVASSTALFYLGMLFAYFVVLRVFALFIVATTPADVEYFPDIGNYFNFVLTLFFAFGVAFEVPIATILLVMAGVVDVDTLASKRPYVFVGAFVLGMLLTPPDIFSQTLLALPMWLLFEVGLVMARMLQRRQRQD
ncbi:MAG: twin-arginine translocase subunit TatC [Candidatus Competibacterales bacterium]